MNDQPHSFTKFHYWFRRADYLRWHRQASNHHILRSQMGFSNAASLRPNACQGCVHYHGVAYGHSQDRTSLICGFHPYGWSQDACPDWRNLETT